MNKPYVVISPPFEITSGGVRVMFGLYGWLLAKGQVAFMNEKPIKGEFIAIYPEIEHGNPAGGSTVVRYILNKPGVVDAIYKDGTIKKGPVEFPSTDKIYYFSRLFGKTREDHYMFLPILNTHVFKDHKRKRTGTAYFVGKAIKDPTFRTRFIHPQHSVLIDRDFAQDQQALADLLNDCEVLYCYDPVTAMTELARLCGCRIVMVNSLYTKDEFRNYEAGMNGMSWGQDQGIPLDSEGFRDHYANLKRQFNKKLDKFIDDTQL